MNNILEIKKTLATLNVAINTQTSDVYVGGLNKNNILHKDENGLFLIQGYGKFLNKKYPIKKYFSDNKEIEALNYFLNS